MAAPLYRLGRLCTRHPLIVIAVWLGLGVAVVAAAKSAGQDTNDNLTLPGTNSQKATDLLADQFPLQANGSVPISIAAPAGQKLSQSRYGNVIDQVTSSYAKDPDVAQAIGPFDKQAVGQISKSGRIGFIALYLSARPTDLPLDDPNRLVDLEQPLENAGLKAAAGGYLGQKVSKPSTDLSGIVGLAAAVVILLLTFGTAVAMGIPIVTALLGLGVGLSVVTLISYVAE